MAHNVYGLTVADVENEIAYHIPLVTFWDERGYHGVANDHREAIADLKLLSDMIRFPDGPVTVSLSRFDADDTNATDNTPAVSADEVNAFVSAIADHVESVTGETVAQ